MPGEITLSKTIVMAKKVSEFYTGDNITGGEETLYAVLTMKNDDQEKSDRQHRYVAIHSDYRYLSVDQALKEITKKLLIEHSVYLDDPTLIEGGCPNGASSYLLTSFVQYSQEEVNKRDLKKLPISPPDPGIIKVSLVEYAPGTIETAPPEKDKTAPIQTLQNNGENHSKTEKRVLGNRPRGNTITELPSQTGNNIQSRGVNKQTNTSQSYNVTGPASNRQTTQTARSLHLDIERNLGRQQSSRSLTGLEKEPKNLIFEYDLKCGRTVSQLYSEAEQRTVYLRFCEKINDYKKEFLVPVSRMYGNIDLVRVINHIRTEYVKQYSTGNACITKNMTEKFVSYRDIKALQADEASYREIRRLAEPPIDLALKYHCSNQGEVVQYQETDTHSYQASKHRKTVKQLYKEASAAKGVNLYLRLTLPIVQGVSIEYALPQEETLHILISEEYGEMPLSIVFQDISRQFSSKLKKRFDIDDSVLENYAFSKYDKHIVSYLDKINMRAIVFNFKPPKRIYLVINEEKAREIERQQGSTAMLLRLKKVRREKNRNNKDEDPDYNLRFKVLCQMLQEIAKTIESGYEVKLELESNGVPHEPIRSSSFCKKELPKRNIEAFKRFFCKIEPEQIKQLEEHGFCLSYFNILEAYVLACQHILKKETGGVCLDTTSTNLLQTFCKNLVVQMKLNQQYKMLLAQQYTQEMNHDTCDEVSKNFAEKEQHTINDNTPIEESSHILTPVTPTNSQNKKNQRLRPSLSVTALFTCLPTSELNELDKNRENKDLLRSAPPRYDSSTFTKRYGPTYFKPRAQQPSLLTRVLTGARQFLGNLIH